MFDLTQSDGALARQLVEEYPEGAETFDADLTRPLLYGANPDPARYARICALAFELTDSGERRATFALERVNGERRVRGTWDMAATLQSLEDAKQLIAMVSEPRRNRLEELRRYHAGIVYREGGLYERAAEEQEQAAASAPDPVTAQISRFCATAERGHHALVTGDHDLMASTLETARLAGDGLMKFDLTNFAEPIRGTLIRWQVADRRAHLLYLHYLAGLTYDGYERDMDEFLTALPDGLAKTYTHWRLALGAVNALTVGQLHAATALADETIALDTYAATTALAKLVLARVASAEGLKGVAKSHLTSVTYQPGHGGHFVRAVASRELAALK